MPGIKPEPGNQPGQFYITTSDGVKIEILEDKTIGVPLRFQHVHFNIEPKRVDQVFDVAPRMAPNGTTKVAFLYDPWGTYMS